MFFTVSATVLMLGLCVDGFSPLSIKRGVLPLAFSENSQAFFPLSTQQTTPYTFLGPKNNDNKWLLRASSQNDDDDSTDDREGMADAFSSLDSLSADDFGAPTKKDNDIMSKKMLELQKALQEEENVGPVELETEEEMKAYTNMFNELQSDGEQKMYDSIIGDMGGTKKKITIDKSVLDDADGIGSQLEDDSALAEQLIVNVSDDSKDLIEKAVKEALAEAKTMGAPTASSDPNSILNDEEMMKDLNAVFEKANEQLLAGVAEIKTEQDALSQESADKRSNTVDEEEKRLANAQKSVTRLVDSVKKETQEVEKAVAQLKEAQVEFNKDPMMRAADLKAGGIVKQGALVGTLLFSSRALGDLVAIGGVDGSSHAAAAAIQAVIAIACAAYFFFF